MSDEQRQSQMDWALGTTADELCAAFDAAGDHPRIRWCVEHNQLPPTNSEGCLAGQHFMNEPCRVVDAILVPLPEQP